MIVMNENIVFFYIINKEGQLILKNEQYVYIYINNISIKYILELCFIRQCFF